MSAPVGVVGAIKHARGVEHFTDECNLCAVTDAAERSHATIELLRMMVVQAEDSETLNYDRWQDAERRLML